MGRLVYFPLMVFAALGFALSLIAHVLSLLSITLPGGDTVFLLHVGIFVVWFPVVFISRSLTRTARPKDFWKAVLAGCPYWMRAAAIVLFIYAVANFIIFMLETATTHDASGSPRVIRGFSGHWMIFYFAAFAVLYSRYYGNGPPRCPKGHDVSPSDVFCSVCGAPVAAARES